MGGKGQQKGVSRTGKKGTLTGVAGLLGRGFGRGSSVRDQHSPDQAIHRTCSDHGCVPSLLLGLWLSAERPQGWIEHLGAGLVPAPALSAWASVHRAQRPAFREEQAGNAPEVCSEPSLRRGSTAPGCSKGHAVCRQRVDVCVRPRSGRVCSTASHAGLRLL